MNQDQIIGAFVGGLTVVTVLFSVAWYVLQVIGYWKVFTKAGEAGWKSIIPFYNGYIQYRLTWKASMFWIMLALTFVGGIMFQQCTGLMQVLGTLITVAGIVLNTIGLNKLSRSFGHGGGYTVGLFFLEPIFTMILGFGSSQYIGNTTETAKSAEEK